MPIHLTDTEWIMIVVAAIYLFECACWLRRDAVCLCTILGRFRALPSPSFMGNERKKLVITNPSPLARSFVCETWPIIISPEGICLAEGARIGSNGALERRAIAFDEMRDGVVVAETEVRFCHSVIAICASEEQARLLAAMIGEVAVASPADRGKLIGEHLDRWTGYAAAAERFDELKELVAPLRASSLTLFFVAFIIGSALYFAPWRLSWPLIACYFALLFSIWMLAVWDYSVCRKKLLGETFSQRFRHVGMLLLSPAGAMRAPEALLRGGLATFHPLAAAAALCTKDRLAVLAQPMMLALEHPTPGELPYDPAARRIDEWFRKKLLKRLRGLLGRLEVDVDDLLRPPEPLYDSRSYCPRCHNQYVLAEGVCADCGGLPLTAYPQVSADEKAGVL